MYCFGKRIQHLISPYIFHIFWLLLLFSLLPLSKFQNSMTSISHCNHFYLLLSHQVEKLKALTKVYNQKMGISNGQEHFLRAMELVTSVSLTKTLLTVVQLKVLDAIAQAGRDASLSAKEIVSRLNIVNHEAPDMLDRMLRLLASYSIVTCTEGVHESKPVREYGLTPVSRYFIPNENGVSLATNMEMGQGRVFEDIWFGFEDSVRTGGILFDNIHGRSFFEYLALDAKFDKNFNNSMVNHTTFVMKKILDCYDGFNNLKRVVDVGGGLGININMIVTKHPHIKGVNFDLPHVIQHAPVYPGIEHVGGDMFKEIPQGDAIFLKWILHDWSDNHCVKLLQNCYKALPDDGKVILAESIVPFTTDTSSSTKVTTQMDVMMMACFSGGKERSEDEFLILAKDAGFKGMRNKCSAYNIWVLELFK